MKFSQYLLTITCIIGVVQAVRSYEEVEAEANTQYNRENPNDWGLDIDEWFPVTEEDKAWYIEERTNLIEPLVEKEAIFLWDKYMLRDKKSKSDQDEAPATRTKKKHPKWRDLEFSERRNYRGYVREFMNTKKDSLYRLELLTYLGLNKVEAEEMENERSTEIQPELSIQRYRQSLRTVRGRRGCQTGTKATPARRLQRRQKQCKAQKRRSKAQRYVRGDPAAAHGRAGAGAGRSRFDLKTVRKINENLRIHKNSSTPVNARRKICEDKNYG